MKLKLQFPYLFLMFFLGLNFNITAQPLLKCNQKTIINGKTWIPKTSITSGKQFFNEKMDLNGSFLYKGVQFDHITFAYDISNEKVITAIETMDNTKRNIIVNPYFLEGFKVKTATSEFDFLRGDLVHPNLNQESYYQIIKIKDIQYIIKRKKHKILRSDQSKKFKYVMANRLYIIKDHKLINVNGKSDILKLFPNSKKEIKRFIRTNKLKIGTKNPMDAVHVLSQFNL